MTPVISKRMRRCTLGTVVQRRKGNQSEEFGASHYGMAGLLRRPFV